MRKKEFFLHIFRYFLFERRKKEGFEENVSTYAKIEYVYSQGN